MRTSLWRDSPSYGLSRRGSTPDIMNTYPNIPPDLARSLERLDKQAAWVASLDPPTMKTSHLLRAYAVLTSRDPMPTNAALDRAWRGKAQEIAMEIDRRFPVPVRSQDE